jgi:hypothetical protein
MSTRKQGTFIHGIAASEHLDSSGERIKIEGIDISSLTKDGVFNYEHKSDNASQTVGKIFEAKKIFKRSDCDNDNHRYFWDKIKTPFLYVAGELLDGVGHSGAMDVASMLRYDQQEPINKDAKRLINFSIEGNRLENRDSVITKCICRKITITITACNKVCEAEEMKRDDSDIDKAGFSEHAQTFSFVQDLMSKGEQVSSCQIMKGEVTCLEKADPGMKMPKTSLQPKPYTPKREFTPESAPKKLEVGDRISYPKKHKSPKEFYGPKPNIPNWKKDEKSMKVSPKEMAKEHKKLVDVLESPSHKDDAKEAKKQKKELKEYKKKAKIKKNFVPTDAKTFAPGVAKDEDGIHRQLKQRTDQKQRRKKPVSRTGPKKPQQKTPQSQRKRRYSLGLYDSNMRKAIVAGSGMGTPSTKTQGDALSQKKTAVPMQNTSALPKLNPQDKGSRQSMGKNEALKTIKKQNTKTIQKNSLKKSSWLYNPSDPMYHIMNGYDSEKSGYGVGQSVWDSEGKGYHLHSKYAEPYTPGTLKEGRNRSFSAEGPNRSHYHKAEQLKEALGHLKAGKSVVVESTGFGRRMEYLPEHADEIETALKPVFFKKFERLKVLKLLSDQAFNSFKKHEELVCFLQQELPNRTDKEILALAKTVAYVHEKKQELKLKKMLGK